MGFCRRRETDHGSSRYEGTKPRPSRDGGEVKNVSEAEDWVLHTDAAFLGWYVIELILKLIVYRQYFFIGDECSFRRSLLT